MKKKYLVTFSLDKNEAYNRNYILLHQSSIDGNFNHVTDYPNYNQLKSNIKYNEIFFKKNFFKLAETLNKIHNVNFDLDFWKIFLGPWFENFTFIIHDRWERLFDLKKKENFNLIKGFNYNNKDFCTNAYEDFLKIIDTDYWNTIVYQKIIEHTKICSVEKVPLVKINKKNKIHHNKIGIGNKINNKALKIFGKRQKYVFFNTYLPIKNEVIVNLKLKQFPLFRKYYFDAEDYGYNQKTRIKNFKIFGNTTFEKFLDKIIFLFLPKVFLEGFNDIDKIIAKENLPKKPNSILCGIIPSRSHIMKYLAYQKIKKTKILTIQHGGQSQTLTPDANFRKKNFKINLRWSKLRELGSKKIYSIGYSKKIYKNSNLKNIYIFLYNHSKYMNKPHIHENLLNSNYIRKILDFLDLLSGNVRNNIKLRLIGFDHFNLEKQIKKKFPLIEFQNDNIKIKNIFSQAKFIITTYNSTAVIESIMSNIPTCLLIDEFEYQRSIRKNYKKYFSELKKVKILHTNINSASTHINEVFLGNKIEKWWNSKKTIKSINNFKKNICWINKNINNDIYNYIKK